MNPVKVKNIEIGTGMPKIIVPIVGVTKEEILTTARSFNTIPLDVVEWRADWFGTHEYLILYRHQRK